MGVKKPRGDVDEPQMSSLRSRFLEGRLQPKQKAEEKKMDAEAKAKKKAKEKACR